MANVLKYKSKIHSSDRSHWSRTRNQADRIRFAKKQLRRQLRRELKKANTESGHNIVVTGTSWD